MTVTRTSCVTVYTLSLITVIHFHLANCNSLNYPHGRLMSRRRIRDTRWAAWRVWWAWRCFSMSCSIHDLCPRSMHTFPLPPKSWCLSCPLFFFSPPLLAVVCYRISTSSIFFFSTSKLYACTVYHDQHCISTIMIVTTMTWKLAIVLSGSKTRVRASFRKLYNSVTRRMFSNSFTTFVVVRRPAWYLAYTSCSKYSSLGFTWCKPVAQACRRLKRFPSWYRCRHNFQLNYYKNASYPLRNPKLAGLTASPRIALLLLSHSISKSFHRFKMRYASLVMICAITPVMLATPVPLAQGLDLITRHN